MPTNLINTRPADTYGQLLHIDGGPSGTEKIVYSGTGVATALKLGTASASIGNIRIQGNVISAISGVITFGTAVNISFGSITGQAYASFFDAGTTDQTGSTTTRTAVKWATAAVTGAGVTVASNSRITLAAAGTYRINTSLQFLNSDNTVRTIDVWFAKNGINIPNSAARLTLPKSSEGGTYLAAYEIFEVVAAGDYLEMYWHPSNVSAKLHYIAPVAENVGVTPAIPAIPPAIVVVQRIA